MAWEHILARPSPLPPAPLLGAFSALDLALNRFAHEFHPVFALGENGRDPFERAGGKLYGRAFWPALLSSHA
jgi:hypothetical protein